MKLLNLLNGVMHRLTLMGIIKGLQSTGPFMIALVVAIIIVV